MKIYEDRYTSNAIDDDLSSHHNYWVHTNSTVQNATSYVHKKVKGVCVEA